ncbi:MAG: glutamine-hydrolyzing carbamoyl-phosphate synthase small subunit [Armatimonadota bacterium]|nr:glutamine-hydrolyzing carbamoyl-phosphate synthase small subunit [Armatimonadota bacterium]MDR7454502.1 glutamine-hydrolyzing carbamoyl-phosphate synthase small subunit [Armatimonadota bacterium]MDR7456717.1 glutamine-hydrolyzing carbamoyl-phosphate synthase small subunit [Armatimonadota bacterium]MDR7496203.1 glutamine-hydrolyzing carbamoyl-phosphate synthase small subunit [Armatimonadota bacterium]MDR7511521.1 glutamine-hydrolyzing carbamoyl-phosphate synthase small subunit [Armatimonadota
MQATLTLDDGLILTGRAIGATAPAGGEVVFTTSLTGYQEVLSDPSYRGQIVVMAYPLIGNYGFHDAHLESARPQAAGFVVRWAAPASGGRADLDAYLRAWGVAGVADVDTRRLVRHLRTGGVRRGVITTARESPGDLIARARAVPDLGELDLVAQVSTREVVRWPAPGPRIAVLDCGAKQGIVAHLRARGCEVVLFPHDAEAGAIREERPAGLVVTNGPGDPARLGAVAAQVRALCEEMPVMGICLGHQILAIGAGARTFKLPFGHRGSNHPVRDETTGRVAITTQNHGYAVDEASLGGTGFEVTHRNLHDGTVEGMRHRRLPVFSVQYHPEGRPGPQDSAHLFDRFLAMAGGRA